MTLHAEPAGNIKPCTSIAGLNWGVDGRNRRRSPAVSRQGMGWRPRNKNCPLFPGFDISSPFVSTRSISVQMVRTPKSFGTTRARLTIWAGASSKAVKGGGFSFFSWGGGLAGEGGVCVALIQSSVLKLFHWVILPPDFCWTYSFAEEELNICVVLNHVVLYLNFSSPEF